MSKKHAGKLRFYWIISMTAFHTFWASFKMIFASFLTRNQRQMIDRALSLWAKRLLSLVGVTTKAIGLDFIPKKKDRPIIVMSNHSSLYDIPIAINALNISFRFVAKKELFKLFVFGAAMARSEFISIDRSNTEQAMKDLKKAKEKMLDGITLWMAPEGTRSKDGKLHPFKRGAFHVAIDTKALILPIVVKDIHKVQAGDDLRLYLKQQIEVEICEPVDAAEYDVSTRKLLVKQVRERMLKALNQEDHFATKNKLEKGKSSQEQTDQQKEETNG